MLAHLRRPLRLALLFGALLLPFVAVELPAQAQRAGRRPQRARLARASRARAAQRRARLARERARQATPRADGVDMDFAMEAIEHERPPPPVNDLAEVEARRDAARRRNLDPELYGGASRDDERPPGFASSGPAEVGEHSPLRVRALLRAFHRGLTFSGVERGPITDYILPVGPAAGFGVEYYPGAHVTNSALAHLGVHVDFRHSFAVESQGPNDIAYPTTARAWLAGLRLRLPFGGGTELGLELAGGQETFRVERGGLDQEAPVGVPFTDYSFLRAGVSFRIHAGDYALGGRVAYLPSFDLGPLGTELGGGLGHGVEAGFVVAIPLGLGFSFLAEAEARVFVLQLEPTSSARSAARGAIDRYVGVNAGVEWDFPAATQL
ncbi:MAG: hypothetical protein KF729_25645 [Sandaracinaceae bacterium]|nr:hypothetical protein [Sandaracinaceae bacterium]